MKRLSILLGFISLFSMLNLKAQDPWIIQADKIDAQNYYGISVSNGVIGVVSSPTPLRVKEVILAGVYDQYGRGRTSNFLPSFNLLDLKLTIDWEDVSIDNISNYKQQLDMQTGIFSGSFDFKDIASVEYSYCALRHLPHNTMLSVKVTSRKKDIHIVAENVLLTPAALRDDQHFYNEINPSHAYIPLLTSKAKSPSGKIDIVASNTFLFEEEHGKQPKVMHEMRDSDSHLMKFVKRIGANSPYSFSLIGTLISSEQVNDPYNQAERLAIYANLQGKESLMDNHKQAWAKLWESDITIEGDPQVQQDVHNMLYHLYSFTREGSKYPLSPMGLSGTGYNGHVFWDTEIFMFPPLLYLQPEIAKGLIEYRFDRLGAAKRNASSYGYQGALFPWESAMSGEEECPVWALSGTYEHHITGDIAFAAWQYYLVTQDKTWLKEKGWPILQGTADFWVSRVVENQGKYEIRNVVCADEWAENVDNNAYTNAIAKLNLEYAVECAKLLNYSINDKWLTIAKNLVFSKMENGVTREHDSYDGQNIKQADVNLLTYPLKVITDKNQIKKDLEYYISKVPPTNTPAMTKSIFSTIYSRLGDSVNAYKLFKESYEPNLLPPFRVMAEMQGSTNPYFITGAGGVLQSIIMGFGGIDIDSKGNINQLKTSLPSHWTKLEIKGVGKDRRTYMVR